MNTDIHSSRSQDWWWKGHLFSRPMTPSPAMVGREIHKEQIRAFLESDTTTALHIVGIGGVGKTWLTGWLAWKGREANRPIGWIECSQKAVTVESLVDSIASATDNRKIKSLLEHLEDQPAIGGSDPLANALDECTDALDRSRCILVLDDFHDLSEGAATDLEYRFLAAIIPHLRQSKLVIVSRRSPAIWDNPKLRPFQERVRLQGFTEEETKAFLTSKSVELPLELIGALQRKTGDGVPMALELLSARLQGISSHPELKRVIQETPIYRVSGVGKWLDAQVEDIKTRASKLLYTMSILRRSESIKFCEKLWQHVEPNKDFESRLKALKSRCLLDVTDYEISISNLFREYISRERLSDADRFTFHDRASATYLEEANRIDDLACQKDYLVESIWHASQSSNFERVLEAARRIRNLPRIGDDLALLAQVDGQVIQAAKEVESYRSLADWSCLFGNRLRLSGDVTKAISVLREAYSIAPSYLSQEDKIRVLRLLAGTLYAIGDYEEAEVNYRRYLELAQAMDDLDRELDARVELANTQLRTNRISQAEEELNLSTKLARELRNRDIESKALCKKGRLYLKHKYKPSAQEKAYGILLDALNGFRETGNLSGQAEANGLLGDFHRYKGDIKLALEYYQKARKIEQQLGHRAKEAITIGQMAFLQRDQGKYEEALRLSDISLELAERLGNPKGKQINLVLGGELLLALGKPEEALKRIEEGLQMSHTPKLDRVGEASAYRALAKYHQYKGDHNAAKDSIERALTGYVETDSSQYAKETWEIGESIYKDWASYSDVEIVSRELRRIAGDSKEVYYEDRLTLLADLLLTKLTESEKPSRYLEKMVEQLTLADIPEENWMTGVLQFCINEWPILSTRVLEKMILWLKPTNQRNEMYQTWIAAAIRDEERASFETIVEEIESERFSFEDQFTLLEPLEPEIVEEPDLQNVKDRMATIYSNGLTIELGRCIRERRHLPPYARDARRALRYLDRERFAYLESEVIQSELREARDDGVVDEDYDPIPAEVPDPDLSDKHVVLLGGQGKVRKLVAQDALERFGLELVEVPPDWEREVRCKRVRDVIRGADLAVKVPRCMTHKITNCLASIGSDVKVIDAMGTGKSSIIRAVKEYFIE